MNFETKISEKLRNLVVIKRDLLQQKRLLTEQLSKLKLNIRNTNNQKRQLLQRKREINEQLKNYNIEIKNIRAEKARIKPRKPRKPKEPPIKSILGKRGGKRKVSITEPELKSRRKIERLKASFPEIAANKKKGDASRVINDRSAHTSDHYEKHLKNDYKTIIDNNIQKLKEADKKTKQKSEKRGDPFNPIEDNYKEQIKNLLEIINKDGKTLSSDGFKTKYRDKIQIIRDIESAYRLTSILL